MLQAEWINELRIILQKEYCSKHQKQQEEQLQKWSLECHRPVLQNLCWVTQGEYGYLYSESISRNHKKGKCNPANSVCRTWLENIWRWWKCIFCLNSWGKQHICASYSMYVSRSSWKPEGCLSLLNFLFWNLIFLWQMLRQGPDIYWMPCLGLQSSLVSFSCIHWQIHITAGQTFWKSHQWFDKVNSIAQSHGLNYMQFILTCRTLRQNPLTLPFYNERIRE